jgi:hypothetical protein
MIMSQGSIIVTLGSDTSNVEYNLHLLTDLNFTCVLGSHEAWFEEYKHSVVPLAKAKFGE